MKDSGSRATPGNQLLWVLAELTYGCPLHCVYCSNPVALSHHTNELTTGVWLRAFEEARDLGAAQLGFSGGEPLLRDDLETLVRRASRLGYYTNLITSGIGLDEKRAHALRDAGLDHVQLSLQDSTRELNDFLARANTFDLKLRVAHLLRTIGYPIVLNVVIHRRNIDHVPEILTLAERLEVDYLELANTQFYGWALLNRDALLPSREQVDRAEEAVRKFRERIGDRMKVYFVASDYHERRPKACTGGWGVMYLSIAPDGTASPCNQARAITGMDFPKISERSIAWIWRESPAFSRFRGFDWMTEPCASCPERFQDFGGCRCQAFLLTGDAANTDPVCELSPRHNLVLDAVARANLSGATASLRFREAKGESRRDKNLGRKRQRNS
ncbi:MAG TPA: pyrroloquinoline quinone biosynthesis protein PqqE [Candidatus Binataceae bacterium]|nr:pyrroloquinoline quinone biosynthesis protein PqqE [Candidatus Binataceae bacterium]